MKRGSLNFYVRSKQPASETADAQTVEPGLHAQRGFDLI
jgi:hypothetical protein